mmetsp:Transcript_25946/g.42155  ORF Transcript_25946/g.42155 Transcript_25946/m.42155 type:complete len:208 (+) Transcript_25946:372-995(+)
MAVCTLSSDLTFTCSPSLAARSASLALFPPRASIRSINTVSSQSKCNASSGGPHSSTKSLAFSKLLGNPSSNILRPGCNLILLRINAVTNAELTKSPLAMISATSLPSGVCASTSSRNISPHDRCTAPQSFASRSHNAPLPLPGPPTTSTMRAGASPRIRSAARRKQSRRRRPSLWALMSDIKDCKVCSSGFSPTDSRRSLMRFGVR